MNPLTVPIMIRIMIVGKATNVFIRVCNTGAYLRQGLLFFGGASLEEIPKRSQNRRRSSFCKKHEGTAWTFEVNRARRRKVLVEHVAPHVMAPSVACGEACRTVIHGSGFSYTFHVWFRNCPKPLKRQAASSRRRRAPEGCDPGL